MNTEQARKTLESWEKSRALSKSRFVLLLGGFFAGWMFITFTVIDVIADGTGREIGKFVVNLAACVISGALFGLWMWWWGERSYRKANAVLDAEERSEEPEGA